METVIMISSRWNRREFCYAGFLALFSVQENQTSRLRLPEPEFQIGDRVRTERICDDNRSPNYGGIDWESGFVVGYCWQYVEWRRESYRRGWTYWVRFDRTNNEVFNDRQWIDFVHHSKVIRE